MYINIIPLTKLPLSRPQIYTYKAGHLKDSLQIGQLVEAPLYHRNIAGIVTNITNQADPGIKYKNINKIIDELPLLSAKDLALAQWASQYYLCPLGLLLKQLLPEPPKRKIKKISEALEKMDLTVINNNLEHEENQLNGGKTRLAVGILVKRQKEYLKIISECLKEKKQILFLVPELVMMAQTLDWLKKKFIGEEIIILHSELSKSEQYINWRKAQTGVAKIFLGTRRAILTPFENLEALILDEEQSISYKQWDMNPRYDARIMAEKKANNYGCKLIFGSSAPSVSGYYKHKKNLISIPAETIIRPEIIDMRDELKKGNYSIFSEDLKNSLRDTMAKGKKSLLFVNRRGASTFVMCRDCGHVIRCPQCKTALMERASNILSCNHCSLRVASPPVCPKCKSSRIKGFGTGIEKVDLELKKIMPHAETLSLDTSNTSRLKTARDKFEGFNKKADIIIGTQIALPLNSPDIELTAAINIDSILNFPDWRTDEKSWQILSALYQRKNIKKCLIQTYNPNNRLLKLLGTPSTTTGALDVFYKQELKNRQALKYPPFIKMIKLICKSDDYNYLIKESARVAKQLKEQNIKEIDIIGPVKPINEKIRNFWFRHIIIKLTLPYYQGLTNDPKNDIIEKILKNLPNYWSIDVDPLT